jgi:hypothetical protein
MKHARKTALAASAFTCAALLSFGWSDQRGVSLSVESAQARVGRPLTPVSVAGVARLARSRPPHLTGDGEAPPTRQAQVTTEVVLTSVVLFGESRPPHLTGDGEATPTKQAQVTTQVVLTSVVLFGAPGRPTTAVTQPQPGAV